MDDTETYPCYILVGDDEDSDVYMELPTEKDGSILLSTIQAQFPNAIGLKFKSSSGLWRGVRISDNILHPPFEGWDDNHYVITLPKQDPVKRKMDGLMNHGPEAKLIKTGKSGDYLSDLIVLGLPYKATEDDLKDYFSNNGELAMAEVKYDPVTKKSRGFGFIRFKDEETALKVVKSDHFIMGRRCEVRLPKKKDDTPMKLFVGRLPEGTQQEHLNKYFSDFGELQDVYVPVPFRGFGFVTFASSAVARHVINGTHTIQGGRINVAYAEPKKQIEQAEPPVGQTQDPPFNFEDMRNVMQMNSTAFSGSKSPNNNMMKSMQYGYFNTRNKPYNKTNGKGLNGV